jgi:hypothetical protein
VDGEAWADSTNDKETREAVNAEVPDELVPVMKQLIHGLLENYKKQSDPKDSAKEIDRIVKRN